MLPRKTGRETALFVLQASRESVSGAEKKARKLELRIKQLEAEQKQATERKVAQEQQRQVMDRAQMVLQAEQVQKAEQKLLQAQKEAAEIAEQKAEKQFAEKQAQMKSDADSAAESAQKMGAEHLRELGQLNDQLNFVQDEALAEQQGHTQQMDQLRQSQAAVQLKAKALELELSQARKQTESAHGKATTLSCENSERSRMVESLKSQLVVLTSEANLLREQSAGHAAELEESRTKYGVLKSQAEQDTAVLYEEVRRSELECLRLKEHTSQVAEKSKQLQQHLDNSNVRQQENVDHTKVIEQTTKAEVHALKTDLAKLKKTSHAKLEAAAGDKKALQDQLETATKHQKQESRVRDCAN